MELLKKKTGKFFKIFGSYVRALSRLLVWTILMFFSGLQKTLFSRMEVAGVDIKLVPLRCDREEVNDKLAYIDKLCIENPDLAEMAESAYLDDELDYFDEDDD